MPIKHKKHGACKSVALHASLLQSPFLDYAYGCVYLTAGLRVPMHPGKVPSVDVVLHVQIIRSSTLSYTWSSEASNSCTGYRSDVTNILEPFKVLQSLSFPGQRLDIMHLSGTHVLSQPVLDTVANRTGERRLLPPDLVGTTASLCFEHHQHRWHLSESSSGHHARGCLLCPESIDAVHARHRVEMVRMHLAVGHMTTEETDIWTLCMPLPSVGLVGASGSPGGGQDATSAVGTTTAGGESQAGWPPASKAVL